MARKWPTWRSARSEGAQPIRLTPFQVSAARTGIPMTNELYRWARLLGVLRREAYAWNGEGTALGEPLRVVRVDATSAIETEVACLRLGELYVAAIPGELFPELVRGPVEDPPSRARTIRKRRSSQRSPMFCRATNGCCSDWPMTRSATSCRAANGTADHPTRTD